MTMRVTDLEKFALEEILRPYQSMLGFDARLRVLPETLEETAGRFKEPSEWRDRVLSRLNAIGITFPPYIIHPLVDAVRGHSAPGAMEVLRRVKFDYEETRDIRPSTVMLIEAAISVASPTTGEWFLALDCEDNVCGITQDHGEAIAALSRLYDYERGRIERLVPAALSTAPSGDGVPGMVLVPREPTPEMILAFHAAINRWMAEDAEEDDFASDKRVWQAMLSAALSQRGTE